MTYTGLTTNQYERVVSIAKNQKKSVDELVDEIIEWCNCYDSVDEILNDYEDIEMLNN